VRQTSSEIFFPAPDDPGTEAKKICRRRPVRAQCLTFAISNDQRSGICGGLDPDERRNPHRNMQRRKPSDGPAALAAGPRSLLKLRLRGRRARLQLGCG
jgi:WhiB family redox-sensing transcriptional regulator